MTSISSVAAPAQIPQPPQPPQPPRESAANDSSSQGRGRGNPRRGGRGRGRGTDARGGGQGRTSFPPRDNSGRGSGGSRGNVRGNRRRANHNIPPSTRIETGSGRTFGGSLTRADDGSGSRDIPSNRTQNGVQREQPHNSQEPASLRPDAPNFVPGRPHVHVPAAGPSTPATRSTTAAPKNTPKQRQQRPPRTVAKSTAEDIATRTHEDIVNGFYECPICTSELGRRSKVWSCTCCWTVFHLSCIRKWSRNEGSVMARPTAENGDLHPRQWRCPGCNLPQDILPSIYSCWCEKEVDPRPLPGLPPHSCGQTCSKSRNGCPHPCDSVCHAGPCPPCQAMGPTQSCFCGLQQSIKKCVDTDYEKGWSCQNICGEMLPCLQHTCPRPCHEGLCGSCEELVDATCYCGKVSKELHCRERGQEKQTERELNADDGATIETWMGTFNCGDACGRLYACGVHRCEEQCHPQDRAVPHCPNSPALVKHCQCGKTLLSDIPNSTPRETCEDPISTCDEPCGKPLPCGHSCPMVCHSGSCPPCFLKVDIKCRCGRSSFKSLCHQGVDIPPQCLRLCKATMNCGRHSCGERCCSGERKSIERQATKRKLKPFVANNMIRDDDIEAEHICTRVCGKLLKCSKHECQELCHKGGCNTCPEAIFEEISCHCGRSVLYPPLPCGTSPPACSFDCERPKPCGHPRTPHSCHMDDEACPKCPFLTEKRCLCWKKVLKNQPCWLTEVHCGMTCGKDLRCGSHKCTKMCHRPGDCEDSESPCKQACGKIKKTCSHPCQEQCHAPFPCKETNACQTTVPISCGCGRIKVQKRCNATRDKGQPTYEPLKCDEECGRLQRNRQMASALNIDIDPVTTATGQPQDSDSLPYSDKTLDMYIQLSSSSTLSALQGYETAIHSLAASTAERSTRFQPARTQLRAFIHSLAEDWGLKSESFDPEPHRHVLVFKSPGSIPPALDTANPSRIGIRGLSVSECVRLRDRERTKTKKAAAEKAKIDALEQSATQGAEVDADGWAQVVSRKRQPGTTTNAGGPEGVSSQYGFGGTTSSFGGSGTFGRLVLKSGVGMGRSLMAGSGAGGMKVESDDSDDDEVAEDWEKEMEKQETKQKEKERKRLSRELEVAESAASKED